jgi:octaprenyl-diphosphate synthase
MSLLPSTLPSNCLNTDLDSFIVLFEDELLSTLSSVDKPVYSSAKKLLCSGGKRIRPRLCFASGQKNSSLDDVIRASIILELVHTASLVHDDILDGASFRRNQATIHEHIGTHDAVLVGDALFSYGLELSTNFSDNNVCRIISKAIRKTCSGEIIQNSFMGNPTLSLSSYEDFISDKTGCLFGAACKIGGLISDADPFEQDCLESIGMSFGVNYQLFDDIIDAFGSEAKIGKTLGTDFLSQKQTLPSILLREEASTIDLNHIDELILLGEKSESGIKLFNTYLGRYDVLNKCVDVFNSRIQKTKFLINSLHDESRKSLLNSFFESFSHKLSHLNSLNSSNFLAVHI